jgi:lysozyme
VCPAGKWTVGYGHVGSDVCPGKQISQFDADCLLKQDLMEAAGHVRRLVTVELEDSQRSALISFVFNVGCGNLYSSTLLKILNNGAPRMAVADEFLRWDKANGKPLEGLLRRREAERSLFLS